MHRFEIETLEQRLVFWAVPLATPSLPGNCTDDCPCSCANVSATQDDSAMTNKTIGGISLTYNSSVTTRPVVTFNEEIPGAGDGYLEVESDGTVGFDDRYFVNRSETGYNTFSFQANSTLDSGRYFWLAELTTWEDETNTWSEQEFSFQDVINREDSEFGVGWQLDELDKLVTDKSIFNEHFSIDLSGVSLITGDNHAVWFTLTDVGEDFTTYTRDDNAYSFATLVKENDTGIYTLTEPDGTKRVFDSGGLLRSRVDRNGNVLRTYDYTDGLLDSITYFDADPENVRKTMFAHEDGRVTSITDFCDDSGEETSGSQVTLLKYDLDGRLITITQPDPDGNDPLSSPINTYDYYTDADFNNLLKSVTDPRGLTTDVEYDFTRHVSQITERCGGQINITSIPSQLVTLDGEIEENLAELVDTDSTDMFTIATTEIRNVYGREQVITRNQSYQITSIDDAGLSFTQYSYYANPLIGEPGPASFGLLRTITQDPDGDGPQEALVTTYRYDDEAGPNFRLEFGRLTKITNPDGTQQNWTYDEFGHVIEYQDSIHTIWYDVDSAGNVLSMNQVLGEDDRGDEPIDDPTDLTTTYTYTDESDDTLVGLVESIEDPNGNVTFYTYYDNGLVEYIYYAYGNVDDEASEHYFYDNRDRLSEFHDRNDNVTTYVYDNLDRLIERTDPDPDGSGGGNPLPNPVWDYFYDQNGNQTYVTAPDGTVTQYVYDVRDRVFQIIQPHLSDYLETYTKDDSLGTFNSSSPSWSQITRSGSVNGDVYATNGNGGSATYSFSGLTSDKKYNVLVRWVPSSTADEYDKNALFEVLGEDDAVLNKLRTNLNSAPEGLPDGSGKMWLSLGAFSPDSDNTLRVKLRDDDSNGTLVIDAVRLVEVGPVTETVYNCAGNLVKMIDPLNHVTEYDYDLLNRLTERTDPDPDGEDGETYESPVTQYSYNDKGWMILMTDPAGTSTYYQYDDLGRQTNKITTGEEGLAGEYFDDNGKLLHARTDAGVSFEASDEFAGFDDLPDGFSAIWTGAINYPVFESDHVTFFLDSTDQCDLYIDGTRVVHTDGLSGVQSGAAPREGGLHSLTIVFKDTNTGDDSGLTVLLDAGDGESEIPSDIGILHTAEATTTTYDDVGRVTEVIDGLLQGTKYTYDDADRMTRAAAVVLVGTSFEETGEATDYTYDDASNLKTVTDSSAAQNTTTYDYDHLNRVKTESIDVGLDTYERNYKYDGNGNLIEKTDRNGRVTTYEYDALNHIIHEKWYADSEDETADRTFSYTYDIMGNSLSAQDRDASSEYSFYYTFDYDNLNRQTSANLGIAGFDGATFDRTYDAANRRSTSATNFDTGDFFNSYTYDALNRVTSVSQSVRLDSEGYDVAAKRVDFTYNDVSQVETIARFASIDTSNPVAASEFGYDVYHHLISIDHTSGTFSESHAYGYDAAGRLIHETSDLDGISAYFTYDPMSQLTSADRTGGGTDETYSYDDNGNRADYTIDDANRLVDDGTYTYEYDPEGNRTKRTNKATYDYTIYVWDHRNRLIEVQDWDANGTTNTNNDEQVQDVLYQYDGFNQMTRRLVTTGEGTTNTVFVYDEGQVVLQYDGEDGDPLPQTALSHRFLWAPAVDQLLADENVTSLSDASENEVLWALTDRMGSITDAVDSSGIERLHRVFDSFGNVTDESHYDDEHDPVISSGEGYLDEAFAYTGRWFDKATGLQNNLNRPYDSAIGRWLSEDPIGFAGDSSNLYRYAGNSPTNYGDPSGLEDDPIIIIAPPGGGRPIMGRPIRFPGILDPNPSSDPLLIEATPPRLRPPQSGSHCNECAEHPDGPCGQARDWCFQAAGEQYRECQLNESEAICWRRKTLQERDCENGYRRCKERERNRPKQEMRPIQFRPIPRNAWEKACELLKRVFIFVN
jgi:RHS repeat-associated protein